MPDTGAWHCPSCPSYEPAPTASGLGELVGEAVIQLETARVELHVDFPWVRVPGGSGAHGAIDSNSADDVIASRGVVKRSEPGKGRSTRVSVSALNG